MSDSCFVLASRAALRRAISIAGGQAALAEMIGVGQPLVSYWLSKSRDGVSANKVIDIERTTGVRRNELRPDLYPPPHGE